MGSSPVTHSVFQDLYMLASQLAERAFLNFQLFGEKKQYLFMDREEEEEKIPLTLRRASSLRLPSRRTFKGERFIYYLFIYFFFF